MVTLPPPHDAVSFPDDGVASLVPLQIRRRRGGPPTPSHLAVTTFLPATMRWWLGVRQASPSTDAGAAGSHAVARPLPPLPLLDQVLP
jgi:hypothetical protein